MDVLRIGPLSLSEFRSGKIVGPFVSWVFFAVFLGRQIADEVLEEDYMVLDEVESKHEGWHKAYFLLDELNLIHNHRQKLYLLHQKTQD